MTRRPHWRSSFQLGFAVAVLGVVGGIAGCGPGSGEATKSPSGAEGSTARSTSASTARSTSTSTASALAPDGPTESAKVVRVIDGDTIVVDIGGTQYHVRYIGMDTPESVKPDTPVERMALEATAANKTLVAGRTVVLEKDVSDTDRFGRLLRDVWVERDGRLVLVGLELVRTGYATVTTFPPDVKYVDQLLAALDEARTGEVGLWAPSQTP